MVKSKKLNSHQFAKQCEKLSSDECLVLGEIFVSFGNWLVSRSNARDNYINTLLKNQVKEIDAYQMALNMYLNGENLQRAVFIACQKYGVSKNAVELKIHDEMKLQRKYQLEMRNNDIITSYLNGATVDDLANDYKLSKSQIYRIKDR